MAWKVTEKNIKIHTIIDGVDSVEDTKAMISYRKLKALGAKRRVYKNMNVRKLPISKFYV